MAKRVAVKVAKVSQKELEERAAALERDGERLAKRPGDAHMYVRKALAKAVPHIVVGFVDAATTGSVPHLKLTTELLKDSRKRPSVKKGSAARLLEEL